MVAALAATADCFGYGFFDDAAPPVGGIYRFRGSSGRVRWRGDEVKIKEVATEVFTMVNHFEVWWAFFP